jgi:MFS superfamily sulfate permease-like transporter
VPIADFGTNYTGIGWLTLVLPLLLLLIVIVWWRVSWGRGSTRQADVAQATEAAPGTTTPAGRKKPSAGDAAPAVVPLLPAAKLLPLGVAVAVAVAIVVLWLWHTTRRAEG